MEPESYYNIAVTGWLPRRSQSVPYSQALQALAGLSEKRHRDRWLRDVLAAPRNEGVRRGHAALGAAVAANLQDQNDRGIAQAREAGSLLRAAGDRAGALRAESELVYGLQRSRLANARECIDRAAPVEAAATTRGYFWIRGQTLVNLGTCRAILGNSGGAYQDMARGLETARTAGYRTLELRADALLTGEQISAGNLLAAWEHSRSGLDKFWRGAHPSIRAQQYYDFLRSAAEQLDHRQAAFAFHRSSVAAVADSSHHLIEAMVRTQTARAAARAGYPEHVAKQYEIADRIFAEVGQSEAAKAYRLFAGIDRAKAEAQAGAAEAALRRLNGLRKSVEETDSVLAKIRFHQEAGYALNKSGDRSAAGKEWQLAIDQYEQRLGSIQEADARLQALRAAGEAYRGLLSVKWTNEEGAAAALEEWEWFRESDSPQERRRAPLPLDRLQRETFLTFVDLPDGLAVWAFDNRGVKAVRLGVTAGQLRGTADRFARLCADKRSDPDSLRSIGSQLYRWLIAPVESRLEPGRTLVIEPDGPVSAIPFTALVDGKSRFLGSTYAIVVANGVRDYLRRAAQPPVNSSVRALIVAGPELSGNARRSFPPLPGASKEGEMVAARFPAANVLAGTRATVDAVTRNHHTELFHFAGHGFTNAGNGGLLLAPSGNSPTGSEVLDGMRLAGQRWSGCRLAVLSACSTGTGESGGPVNPESLVRRLLWAGVPRVVASLWRVDSETTRELMDIFYSSLLDGLDAPAALRQAGLTIRDREGTRHPYYWAGFQAFGSR